MAFKMNGWSPFTKTIAKRNFKKEIGEQSVDPDAPGTPGKPGYEPPVKFEDLDERGKAIWKKLRNKKVGK